MAATVHSMRLHVSIGQVQAQWHVFTVQVLLAEAPAAQFDCDALIKASFNDRCTQARACPYAPNTKSSTPSAFCFLSSGA